MDWFVAAFARMRVRPHILANAATRYGPPRSDSLDSDLVDLYGLTTKRLNEQVKRNRKRFPEDFMFQLSAEEAAGLRSQFATSSSGHGGRRHRPFAFMEHGAIMAANMLNNPRAVEAGVYVVRAFVKLRQLIATHKELARKLAELE